MIEFINTLLYKLRFIVAGTLIVACLLALPFLPHLVWIDPTVKAADAHSSTNSKNTSLNDSPNLITSGLFKSVDGLERITSKSEQSINSSFKSVTRSMASVTVQSGRFLVHSAGSGLTFMSHATGNVFGFIANVSIGTSIIRPADADKTPLPVIEEMAKTQEALPAKEDVAVEPSQPVANASEAAWPMHGVITTDFGVPHWPYQPLHTGLDISDHKRSGNTPIRPFKPGIVKETIRSNVGLGTRVIVDHGGGITSLYGHLASIAVQVGQEVNKSTILGFEGSTGASTGTHLHFEIMLNGKPVDPRQYINGLP